MNREQIIKDYIAAYNRFDVAGMLAHLAEDILFENIQNGECTLSIQGKEAFEKQAEMAKTYFSERKQSLTAFKHSANETEVEIDYVGILAMDFPKGLKKGDKLEMKGKSVFEFSNDKIRVIRDMS
jgi:ketosteroid isomerase-like protein